MFWLRIQNQFYFFWAVIQTGRRPLAAVNYWCMIGVRPLQGSRWLCCQPPAKLSYTILCNKVATTFKKCIFLVCVRLQLEPSTFLFVLILVFVSVYVYACICIAVLDTPVLSKTFNSLQGRSVLSTWSRVILLPRWVVGQSGQLQSNCKV